MVKKKSQENSIHITITANVDDAVFNVSKLIDKLSELNEQCDILRKKLELINEMKKLET